MTLKAQQHQPKRTPNVPDCPHHKAPLKFDINEGAWKCTSGQCPVMFFPKREIKKGRPLVGKAKEIFVVKDGDTEHVFIRTKQNLMVDITKYVHITKVTKSGHAEAEIKGLGYTEVDA